MTVSLRLLSVPCIPNMPSGIFPLGPGINAKKEVAVNDDGSYKVTLIVNNAVFNLKPKLKIYTDCEDGIKVS